MSLYKAINDAESALAGKEAELARLKEEMRTLEESDPAAEHDLDATACVFTLGNLLLKLPLIRVYRLRLSMYKGLGFEPVADRDGRVTKMLIRTSRLALL